MSGLGALNKRNPFRKGTKSHAQRFKTLTTILTSKKGERSSRTMMDGTESSCGAGGGMGDGGTLATAAQLEAVVANSNELLRSQIAGMTTGLRDEMLRAIAELREEMKNEMMVVGSQLDAAMGRLDGRWG